jgi:unsaturated rhamnogalacturonyl hydrolase
MKGLTRYTLYVIIPAFLLSFNCDRAGSPSAHEVADIMTDSSSGMQWSVAMAETLMKQYGRLWQIEDSTRPKWTYTHGLVALAFLRLWEATNDNRYFGYAKGYADDLIDSSGIIRGYKMEDYNIDKINSGKILFMLYREARDKRYRTAMDTLREQLRKQPRTESGGFWHKKRYPWQMWLDGIYMGAPFYAQYGLEFNESADFDDVAHQVLLIEEKTRDEKTGLLYHGWDESRQQKWADSITGCSPTFWGRAMGWYLMGLVDVLDFLPADHKDRDKVIAVLQRLAAAIVKVQDSESGLWYQVLDQGGREGNYLEGSVSCMFSYTLMKAVKKGYIDESYLANAFRAYEGITRNLARTDSEGNVIIGPVCAVAGLGGSPYRDGSYGYYINERKRDNDPKATGPFIMAGLLYEEMKHAHSGTSSYDIIVAGDGTGDYRTINEAIEALPMFNYERRVIYIRNGIYNEKIRIEQDYVTLIGENRDSTIIRYSQLRDDWESDRDYTGPAVINIHADDIVLNNLTIENTQPAVGPHAFAVYGTGTRTVIVNCNVLSRGADTVSLWNYKEGMYYHSGCYFRGSVDMVCPRGWCFIRGCLFYELRKTAAIWHAGAADSTQKLVIVDSRFDGIDGFALGRHHYDARFILIDCSFSSNMADKPIWRVTYKNEPERNRADIFGGRYFFYNCRRDGGNFTWFADNLHDTHNLQDTGNPKYAYNPAYITPAWTFNNCWDPESEEEPHVKSFVIKDKILTLYFNEILTIRGNLTLETHTGKILKYDSGSGRDAIKLISTVPLTGSDFDKRLLISGGYIIPVRAGIYERAIKREIIL